MRSGRNLYTIRSAPAPALGVLLAEPAEATERQAHYRAPAPTAGLLRSTDGTVATMSVRFSVFDVWYEVNSYWEGHFMERVARGAFRKTMTERGGQVKSLLNHGMEFDIGEKPLGVPIELAEDSDAARMDVALLDTSYNRDQVVPGVEAGAYGASFMFETLRDSWAKEPGESAHNPQGLPERTIQETRLYENGPVTWPASPAATAEMLSEHFMAALRGRDRDRYDALESQFAGFRAQYGTDTRPRATVIPLSTEPIPPTPEPTSDRHARGMTAAARRRALDLAARH